MKKHPNVRGPRAFLDEEKQKLVCVLLEVGLPLTSAADYVGCHVRTIYNTSRRLPDFGLAMRRARAGGEFRLVHKIQQAALERDDWRAATWLLAHCHGERYQNRGSDLVAADLSAALTRFSDVLMREITDGGVRRRILKRMSEVRHDLDAAAVRRLEGPA